MQTDATKRCSRCRLVKPVSDFFRRKMSADGRNSQCKACVSAYNRAWYLKNRQHVIDRSQVWIYNNPWRYRASMAKTRAKKLGRLDPSDPVEIDFVLSLFEKAKEDGHCPVCNLEFDFTIYLGKGQMPLNSPQIDHVIPLSQGGMHIPSNLRVICRSCNSRRNPNSSKG